MYLEALGHSVITARTKSGALAAIPSADCDMFICDIGLPDGNGWDLLKDARFSRPVYAIAISCFAPRVIASEAPKADIASTS